MPVSARTLSLLMAAGLEGEALLAVVQSIDEDCQHVLDFQAERSSAEEYFRRGLEGTE